MTTLSVARGCRGVAVRALGPACRCPTCGAPYHVLVSYPIPPEEAP